MPANTVNYQESGLDISNKYLGYNDYTYLPYTLYDEELKDIVGRGLWGTGRNNNYGQLGQSSIATDYSSPIQIGTLTTWVSAAAGYFSSISIKKDGTLWTWGYNDAGELGHGDVNYRSSPVQVGALTDWSQISAGYTYNLAIKTDGTLWAWGSNNSGKLGDGTLISRSSPIQVGALTTWSTIASGYLDSSAIKTDGTLWSWGTNDNGQLGLGDIIPRSSPVQVGALTTWASVSMGYQDCMAIKTDGTLWGWGRNHQGQLGLGDIIPRSSPVQVGALTNWSKISCGYFYAVAIKTDGTLWAWGYNAFGGPLGTGNTTSYSSPVQVGSLTNWSQISASKEVNAGHSLAIKTDGTLWAWGSNGVGQLGLGNTTSRSSPVQVGTLTTWNKISAGGQHSLFIRG